MKQTNVNELVEKFSGIDLEEVVFDNEEDIRDLVSLMKESDHELEVRFGAFDGKFLPQIDLVTFLRLHKYLNSFAICKEISYNYITVFDNKRKMIRNLKPPVGDQFSYYDCTNEISCTSIMKKRSGCSDNHDYNFRVVLSTETLIEGSDQDITKELPTFFKTRKRFVYFWNDIEIHLSMFKESKRAEDLRDSDVIYDIEVEITNQHNEDLVLNFIKNILAVIQNTERLISNKNLAILKGVYSSIFKSSRFAGVQPVSLKQNDIVGSDWENYALTMKLDGERRLLLVCSRCLILINSKMEFSLLNYKIGSDEYNCYVFDLELFNGNMYLFDLLATGNKDIRSDISLLLLDRLEIVKNFVGLVSPGFDKIKIKEYVFDNIVSSAIKTIRDVFYNTNNTFDGMIFVNKNTEYNCQPMKWKPENLLTIDFKILKCVYIDENPTYPKVRWELYASDKNGDVIFEFPGYPDIHVTYVDISISEMYENNSVVEFLFCKETGSFRPLKSRHDKTKGNYILVAQDVFKSIIYPFNFNWAGKLVTCDNLYFFRFQRFKNYIRRVLISSCTTGRSTRLLDLNCGYGEDLYKYVDSNVKYVYGNVSEKSISTCEGIYSKISSDPTSKNFTMVFSNLGIPENIIETDGETYDLITFFDGIHKYFDSKKLFETFPKNLECLVSGGHLILTTIDSDHLKGSNYNIKTNSFSIEPVKLSKGQFKNSIRIKMGESASLKVVNETELVSTTQISDIQAIKLLLSRKGFEMVKEAEFIDFYESWTYNGNYLSNDEKEYAKCYKALVFRKK